VKSNGKFGFTLEAHGVVEMVSEWSEREA